VFLNDYQKTQNLKEVKSKEISLNLKQSDFMKTSIIKEEKLSFTNQENKSQILKNIKEIKSDNNLPQKIVRLTELQKIRDQLDLNQSESENNESHISDDTINKQIFSVSSLHRDQGSNFQIFKRLNTAVKNYLTVFKSVKETELNDISELTSSKVED
jgi:hypothetical protein